LGSNSIDFLSHKPINHDVDTLFFKRFQEGDDHFEMWYNYGKNSTRTNKLCKVPGGQNIDILQGTETSSGALMVIDVEEINSPLDDSAKEAIVDAVKKAGLTITDEVSQGRTLLLILQEGYVFARTFPERRYCAFDVQLWSSFAKQSVVEKELVAGLESKVSSSYRIVTGGMFSESISQDNKQKSGPRVTATCSEFPGTDNAKVRYIDDAVVRAVVAESVALLSLSGGVIAVICGMDSLPCLSFDAVQEATGGDTAFAVGTCSGVTDLKAWPQDNMVACEDVTKQILQQHVQRLGRISSLVLDPGVPLAMGRILHKLFSDAVFRRKIIADDSYAIVSPILDSSQSWRRELLERFRTDFEVFAPSLRAQVFVSGTNSTLELGLFSSGDSNFYSRLAGSLPRIRAATGLSAEVRHVKNGVLDFRPDFEPSIYASFSDFDSSSSLEQWLSQKPLGQQAIIHTDVKGVKFSAGDKILIDVDSQWYSGRILKARGNSKFDVIYSRDGEKENGVKKERIRFQEGQEPTAVSTSMIKKALESSLESLEVSGAKEILTFEDVGKGCVMAAWWSGGSLVMIWDGRTHLDVNLFTYDEGEEFVDDFERYFADGFSFSLSLSHDIQPRGVGRVVNFRKDLETQEEVPLWVA
jgi:S-adenosylmethionine/arginine decarboxylase-like enzyme